MTLPSISAEDVIGYLSDHPDFFLTHDDVLAHLSLPVAHSGRAISLHERQLEVVRERYRSLELKLAELIRNAQDNDAINQRLQRWTCQLLALTEADDTKRPLAVVEGLMNVFAVPQGAVRLWQVREPYHALPFAAPMPVDVIAQVNAMTQPYCGSSHPIPGAAGVLNDEQTLGSIAWVALRKARDANAFGVLVLGAAETNRFYTGIGTVFLERIGELASAALSPLID